MKKPNPIPEHICHLVDKKNYVIAIKTYAKEQNIGLEEAKNAIDAYEESQKNPILHGSQQLQHGANYPTLPQMVKSTKIPYWVKRFGIVLLVMAIFASLLYQALA